VHPTLGRAIINIIFLLFFLDLLSLLMLKPDEAEFYVAIMSLGILLLFFTIVVIDIRREVKAFPKESAA